MKLEIAHIHFKWKIFDLKTNPYRATTLIVIALDRFEDN